jgi:hypothetical protein
MGPELAVADGALGFWQAVEEAWPKTRGQRCWVHKTANVLNKLPKSQQSKAKRALQEIWMAETKKDALVAFDALVETWGVKYDKAVECLIKDRDALLAGSVTIGRGCDHRLIRRRGEGWYLTRAPAGVRQTPSEPMRAAIRLRQEPFVE